MKKQITFNPMTGMELVSTEDAASDLMAAIKKDPENYHFVLEMMFNSLLKLQATNEIIETGYNIYRLGNNLFLSKPKIKKAPIVCRSNIGSSFHYSFIIRS